ncbi:maleylpyruvate isomerase family mycothiol-dependent enzyme [Actinomadura sp. KC345]|uniref:maleylpyruvate isomerase family mycothiol-dependent enzyme n=1 Tax=Actinomadura sp. KC345 TaxID=2530371 RepID=UPI00104E0DA8|nr:maleylpyruvate isomerase family mycothiol-dependent enzyme [Actinomadura sp. KC345]TDC58538.1 maleylpyruvate isomerase family mycothiol-dependent enzyme [Actinomadura sp. KC345]
MMIFGPAVDVRPLFPRERRAMLDLLGSLSPADWSTPTVCPGWDVHDVVGHVLNDYMRRLSGSRDGFGGAIFADDETLPAYLARTNEEFVRASRQLSPQLMIELLDHLGARLDAVWAARDLQAAADLNVSWAAADIDSPAWLDIGRDYTEFWVHQQQVRDAVSAPGATEPDLMAPVLDIFARGLPHALRMHDRPEGSTAHLEVSGPAGGRWGTIRQDQRWRMAPPQGEPTAHVSMDQDTFWRLATRGITVEQARQRSTTSGDTDLTAAITALLAVVA